MSTAADGTAAVYADRGLGARARPIARPALVVVDFSRGFTSPESPLCCPSEDALSAAEELLAAARAAGAPICFTTVAYSAADRLAAATFLEKVPALADITPDSEWAEIDARLAPREDEWVLRKLFASAFFGTTLSTWLAAAGCDGVVLCGASTSGCVRATAVDAMQHGYRTVVCADACADRAPGAHDASLVDLDAKYADVVATAEALRVFAVA